MKHSALSSILYLSIVLSLLIFTGPAGAVDAKKPVIVASTTQIADFARQVAGDQAVVKSILAPGADPHTYNVTPNDVQIVLGADLCINNGLHLEGKSWMATLAKDAQKPLVTATDGIQVLSIDEGGQTIADPHAWFSPKNAAVYVNNITKGIIALDPENTALYQARARLFLQQLRVLDAWIREQVNKIPVQKRILVT
ncbi:MAG: zinc ABC transporter substrate-binding protein, partial [Desulfobacterales bacterium]|nr:zinc ABC transporter substrate-binding protein [Desulfobacterales bacterium]